VTMDCYRESALLYEAFEFVVQIVFKQLPANSFYPLCTYSSAAFKIFISTLKVEKYFLPTCCRQGWSPLVILLLYSLETLRHRAKPRHKSFFVEKLVYTSGKRFVSSNLTVPISLAGLCKVANYTPIKLSKIVIETRAFIF
jgi:hypothetical protein